MAREEAEPGLSYPGLPLRRIWEQGSISSAGEVCHIFRSRDCSTSSLVSELKAVFERTNILIFTGGCVKSK